MSDMGKWEMRLVAAFIIAWMFSVEFRLWVNAHEMVDTMQWAIHAAAAQ